MVSGIQVELELRFVLNGERGFEPLGCCMEAGESLGVYLSFPQKKGQVGALLCRDIPTIRGEIDPAGRRGGCYVAPRNLGRWI